MRTLKLVVLALVLIGVVILALANREPVTLHLLPEGMAGLVPVSRQMPLFVVILLSIVVGIALGYLFEWLREHKHRRRASANAREAAKLGREIDRLRKQNARPEDDVLTLLGQ
jgi:uncharacterized integral membrane protein